MILDFLTTHLVVYLGSTSGFDATVLLVRILLLEGLLIEINRRRSVVSRTRLWDLLSSRHFESLTDPLSGQKFVDRAAIVGRAQLQLFKLLRFAARAFISHIAIS